MIELLPRMPTTEAFGCISTALCSRRVFPGVTRSGHVRDPYFTISDLRVMGAGLVSDGLRYRNRDEATAGRLAFRSATLDI